MTFLEGFLIDLILCSLAVNLCLSFNYHGGKKIPKTPTWNELLNIKLPEEINDDGQRLQKMKT